MQLERGQEWQRSFISKHWFVKKIVASMQYQKTCYQLGQNQLWDDLQSKSNQSCKYHQHGQRQWVLPTCVQLQNMLLLPLWHASVCYQESTSNGSVMTSNCRSRSFATLVSSQEVVLHVCRMVSWDITHKHAIGLRPYNAMMQQDHEWNRPLIHCTQY